MTNIQKNQRDNVIVLIYTRKRIKNQMLKEHCTVRRSLQPYTYTCSTYSLFYIFDGRTSASVLSTRLVVYHVNVLP